MTDEYTPTTERVRESYVRDQLLAFIASAGEHESEFDRWLAEVRAKVADDLLIELHAAGHRGGAAYIVRERAAAIREGA